jgi:tryptophan 2,3-dioxygenase
MIPKTPDRESAAALRQTLAEPIYNRTLRKDVGRGELDYEVYLRTRELLALQTPIHDLVAPDELLFQVMHQSQELWLKCAVFEATNLVEDLDREEFFGALAALDRIVAIMRTLGDQFQVMFTMSPAQFQIIRRSLGNGSGLESPGYNQILAAKEAVSGALDRLLGRHGTTLLDVYTRPVAFPGLHRVAERLA